jgi:hypothetical protein
MRALIPAFTVVLLSCPAFARADMVLEGSVGVGWEVSPNSGRQPTNIMIAPGYALGDLLKLELGLVANLGDVEGREFDIGIRPMLVISPPLLPVYGRVIMAVNNLAEGPVTYAWGGALGLMLTFGPTGVFIEGDLLPRNAGGEVVWLAEARAGVAFTF